MASNRKSFKFGTFNLKNFALPNVEYYAGESWTTKEYDHKVAWTGNMLSQMDADFVGFQEVWSLDALNAAITKANMSKSDVYTAVQIADSSPSSPRVGFASRFPVLEVETVTNFLHPIVYNDPDFTLNIKAFRRPVLRVVVNVRDVPVTIFIAHLKSKRPEFGKPNQQGFIPEEDMLNGDLFKRTLGTFKALVMRASEAAALRDLAINEGSRNNYPLIVMGDLNDGGHAVTTDMIYGEDPFFSYTWQTVPGSNPPRKYTEDEEQQIKNRLYDVRLYDTEEIQSRRSLVNPIYTHIYNGRYESLDHIMVSQELYYRNPNRIGDVEYLYCFNDHLVDQSLGGREVNAGASDHAPLVAQLRFNV